MEQKAISQHKNSVLLQTARVNGDPYQVVRWIVDGKTKRKFFKGDSAQIRKEAMAYRDELLRQRVGSTEAYQAMDEKTRRDVERYAVAAKDAGMTLPDYILSIFAPTSVSFTTGPTLRETIDEMLTAKLHRQKASARTIQDQGYILRKFAAGREEKFIGDITNSEISEWIGGMKMKDGGGLRDGSKATYWARLGTLFEWAKKRGYIAKSPIDKDDVPKVVKDVIRVFTVEQVEAILRRFETERYRGGVRPCFATFVLTTLWGLRPEEAMKIEWKDIHLDEAGRECVHVLPHSSKKKKFRNVDALKPSAVAWLKTARLLAEKYPAAKGRSEQKQQWGLPVSRGSWLRFTKTLAAFLRQENSGFCWQNDITRHTAVSYLMREYGDAARIADNCGHSVRELQNSYRTLVTKTDAERFWSIWPKTSDASTAPATKTCQ